MTILLSGCEENFQQILIDQEPEVSIINLDGVLKFKNSSVFYETLDSLSKLDPNDYLNWMESFNFISIQSKYWDLINEEIEFDKKNEELFNKNKSVDGLNAHSDLYYELLQAGFIKESSLKDDGIIHHDLNLSAPYLSSILNLDGLYMISDTIIQVTANSIKYWINGDTNNLDKILTTEENSSDIHIFKRIDSKKSTFNPNPKAEITDYPDGDNTRKITLYLYFETWQYLGDGTIWKYNHYINVKSYKKNWLGQWKYNWTAMYIKGAWNGDFQYSDPYEPLNVLSYNFATVFPSDYPNTYDVNGSNLYNSSYLLLIHLIFNSFFLSLVFFVNFNPKSPFPSIIAIAIDSTTLDF